MKASAALLSVGENEATPMEVETVLPSGSEIWLIPFLTFSAVWAAA